VGTRALFIPHDENGNEIAVIYIQFDGYPDGRPLDLFNFMKNRPLVNGYGEDLAVFNGMEDLTAQIITYLKLSLAREREMFLKEGTYKVSDDFKEIQTGVVYVMPPGTRDVGKEYIYEIYPDGNKVKIKAYSVWDAQLIFEGTPAEFVEKFSPK